MPIEINSAIVKLCQAYPGFRDAFVNRADDWVGSEGEILYYVMLWPLTDLVLQRLNAGDYEDTANLFATVELLLTDGSEETGNLIATGFLESMQHQNQLPSELWLPLLGPHALQFCQAMDQFHGIRPHPSHPDRPGCHIFSYSSTRSFTVWSYFVSHGHLLLRSGKYEHKTRVDLLFSDVVWMNLRSWMTHLKIQEVAWSADLQLPLNPDDDEYRLRKVFLIEFDEGKGFVVAGGVSMNEDEREASDFTALLPEDEQQGLGRRMPKP